MTEKDEPAEADHEPPATGDEPVAAGDEPVPAEDEPAPTRPELTRRMDAGRTRLEGLIAGRDEHALLSPLLSNGWSRRDLLVHLAAWQERIGRVMETLQAGREPEPRLHDDSMDAFNARTEAEARQTEPRAAVEREAAAYARVRAMVDAAPHEDLFEPGRFAWAEGEPFVWWIVGNTFGHLEEHLDEQPAGPPQATAS